MGKRGGGGVREVGVGRILNYIVSFVVKSITKHIVKCIVSCLAKMRINIWTGNEAWKGAVF